MTSPALSTIDLVNDLYWHCIVLLIVNVLLTGLAIFFAWRHASAKSRVESLEKELATFKGTAAHDEPTPLNPLPALNRPPVPKMSDLRRIPATKFPKRGS